MSTPVVTGAEVADRLAGELAARADPAQAVPMAAYMRDQFPFLGVKAPAQGRAWAAATAALPRRLPEDEVVAAALDLWDRPEREHQYAACRLVNRHAAASRRAVPPTPELLDVVERLITTRSWWDTVDALAIHATGDLVRRYPDLRPRMDAWLAGDDLWLIRSSLLHMNRWGAARDAGWLFAACLTRADHPDFFVRKAIGWALREHSKVDASAVSAFVAAHAEELSPLSRREALAWLDRRR
ncbi:MAG TPA: DNA alkylation repair protein [Acidimicrobiales bacterium]|nr:DNA alkylation repair protein [Acidimicrobiales bacterium]